MDNVIEVIRKELKEECDYTIEANKLALYKTLLSGNDNYHVPKVYRKYSNKKCLCMEFAEGILVDRFGEEGVAQETRDRIGELLTRLTLKEIFIFRFVQADPNPANFFYDTHKNQLVLIDLGAGYNFSKEFIGNYARLAHSAANKDEKQIVEYFLRLVFKRAKIITGEESKRVIDAYLRTSLALGEAFGQETEPYYDFSTQEATEKVNIN